MELNNIALTGETNEEAKATLEEAGISAAMAAYLVDEKANKVVNSEGLDLGDKFTIVGMADKPDAFETERTDATTGVKKTVLQDYCSVMTVGDRDSISLNRLIGTSKEKYFDKERKNAALKYDRTKVLKLPRRLGAAALAVQTQLKGKTLQLVEIAEGCGANKDRIYYRFIVLD